MGDPVNAADAMIGDTHGANHVDDLRRACGWDGTGEPPTVVIGSDGLLWRLTIGIPGMEGTYPLTKAAPAGHRGRSPQ